MPEDLFVILGNKLRYQRELKGLTIKSLSSISGVSMRHISNVEKGKINPSFDVLFRLAEALNLSLDYLYSDSGNEDEQNIQTLTSLYKECPKKYREMLIAIVSTMSQEMKRIDE